MLKKLVSLGLLFGLAAVSCSSQEQSNTSQIDFGEILAPHYAEALDKHNCEQWRDVDIPVFETQGQRIKFQFGWCDEEVKGEYVEFTYGSKTVNSNDYIFGKLKFPTPEEMFELKPDADKFTTLDIPLFEIVRLENSTPEEYLRKRKLFHKFDWDICKIEKVGKYIWALKNSAFKEVPEENYTLQYYANFKEWEANYRTDKAAYNEKYGAQKLKNRACANEQGYWYITKDGILVKIISPANFSFGINPSSIIYSNTG